MDGYLPIHLAVKGGHAEVVVHLIKTVDDLCLKTSTATPVTPVELAVKLGQFEVLRAILKEENRLADEGFSVPTALIDAVYRKDSALVELLLDHGADVNITVPSPRAPLCSIMEKGESALHLAVRLNSTEMSQLLIERGARMRILSTAKVQPFF